MSVAIAPAADLDISHIRRRRIRLTGLAVVCAFGMAALYTAQHAALQASLGIPIDWGKLVLPQLIHGGLWALLAPVIAISVDRFRLDVDHRARRILILLAIGLALSVIQALAATSITMYRGLAAPAPHSVAARVVDGHVIVLGDNPSTRSQSSAFHFASRNRLVSMVCELKECPSGAE
jgi:hypothetical protein